MSDLWTPSGTGPEPGSPGSVPDLGATAEPAPAPAEDDAAVREQVERIRAELASTPVRDVVANHAIGLWQLAVLHLGLDQEGAPADLPEAKLAIDAMASLVEGVIDRLGDHGDTLKDALTTLRLAYVRVSGDAPAPPASAAAGDEGGGADA